MRTITLPGIPTLDWSVFDDSEIVLIEALLKRGGHEDIAALINNMDPAKEKVIAAVQAAMRPNSFVYQSQAQQEFEIWQAQHPSEITPEIEREWQAKIEKERNDYLRVVSGENTIEKIEITTTGGAKVQMGTISNNLSDLADLPASSREKLNAQGVTSIEQFKEMPYSDKQKALGNKVAARFKDFI